MELPQQCDATTTAILTLGDGDFTFSWDVARMLVVNNEPVPFPFREGGGVVSLTATGIDLLEELTSKYKDATFVLHQLSKCQSPHFSVAVRHGINAIVHPSTTSGDPTTSSSSSPSTDANTNKKFDVVVFNHPHLGVEDAKLHGRFLCHLFYAVNTHWMKSNGIFHLTLVQGQYERWHCERAAQRADMTLIDRCAFAPPHLHHKYGGGSYELRRHQSGKSFKRRRESGGSEIFTYARISDHHRSDLPYTRPFWLPPPNATESPHVDSPFQCPYCTKCFPEKRSLHNHLQGKHLNGLMRKVDEGCTRRRIQCPHCPSDRVNRTFDSPESLLDHIRAKHGGKHTTISPDWKRTPSQGPEPDVPATGEWGMCDVCGHTYKTIAEVTDHLSMFRPDLSTQLCSETSFPCSCCGRSFRERRAQLQHENFCSPRKNSASAEQV